MDDDDAIEAYNSDSGDGDFQMEDMSDEDERKGNSDCDDEKKEGWIQWFTTLEGHEYMT